jgi:hypothetical protein
MKKSFQLLIFAFIFLGLASCGIASQKRSQQQSTFKQNYSIGLFIEKHQDLLMEGSRALSGMETGPNEPFIQSNEYTTFQIASDNTSALMEALRTDIVETINVNGATIVGSSGSDSQADPVAHFSYSYKEAPFYGVVNVWGIRGEGSTFTIISQITESRTQ